jgi:hypothetical protein
MDRGARLVVIRFDKQLWHFSTRGTRICPPGRCHRACSIQKPEVSVRHDRLGRLEVCRGVEFPWHSTSIAGDVEKGVPSPDLFPTFSCLVSPKGTCYLDS